jgi:hypothetical protein
MHDDWRVGDPTGAPVDEVRRVRDDIEIASRRCSPSSKGPN